MKKIVVIGMGYIGVPTAVMFADAGFSVTGIEKRKQRVMEINRGECTIDELILPGKLKKVVKKGRLRCTEDFSPCGDADAIVICVETPLKKNKEPNYSSLKSALGSVRAHLKKRSLILIESTIAPTTTDSVVIPLLEKKGLEAGKDFYLAHCPERIIPGNMLHEIVNNDRIIGALDKRSGRMAKELYSSFVKGRILLTDCRTAEFVKVIENTFRDVNIALANELARICEKLDIDVYEAISLANYHPRVNIHSPGAGVGGHCIPKDPWLLIHGAKGKFNPRLVRLARGINDSMPDHVVKMVESALAEAGKKLRGSRILALGVTYKKNSDDIRETPAMPIIKNLLRKGTRVEAFDPHAPSIKGIKILKENFWRAASDADCILVITAHDEFREIDLKRLKKVMRTCIIVDGRNLFEKEKVERNGFIYKGVGNL